MPTLSNRAYQILEEMIITLKLKPGSFFSETELSQRLEIGRTPLREALKRLCNEGLLETIPRKGMFVTEINLSDQIQLLETRKALDSLIVRSAAINATTEQIHMFKTFSTKFQEAINNNNMKLYLEIDAASDSLIEEAADNKFAINAVRPLHVHSRRFWYYNQKHSNLEQVAQFHIEILESIILRQAETAAKKVIKLNEYLIEFTKKALE